MIRSGGGVFYGPEKKSKNQKNDLMVVRVNKGGDICNARPCCKCLAMMKAVGIRKVYYSVGGDGGKIICEKVKNMVSIQVSTVTKLIEKINGNKLADKHNEYYEALIKQLFPAIIRKHNFDSFVQYNLLNVLPNYKTIIILEKGQSYAKILDYSNKIIACAIITF